MDDSARKQETSTDNTTTKTSKITSTNNKEDNDNQRNHSFGVHGVRLKQFEQVMSNILPHIEPDYVCLPPLPEELDWPFGRLPQSARVLGTSPGQLKNPKRAARKEGQLRSMLRCVLRLADQKRIPGSEFTIVDFGGGSGHLGIPLALLLPTCLIIVVDLRKRSLELMQQKAELVAAEILQTNRDDQKIFTSKISIPSYVHANAAFTACGTNGVLGNLFAFHGPVENYMNRFDMALALHLCGEATDVALRKAAVTDASAMVLAPCCVGKLSQKALNPDIYHATGQNAPTVKYPQSKPFCRLIPEQDDWDALARAADYSNEEEARTNRNATRRTAKALLEMDRRLFLEEMYHYRTALLRMDPWQVTPKNDIIVAWKEDGAATTTAPNRSIFPLRPDLKCQQDIQIARSQLVDGGNLSAECSDWTKEELSEIQSQIQKFLDVTDHLTDKMERILIFPTRMGGRKRKLIHFVAGKMDLAHWCEGKKDSEKTVAVARRGRQSKKKQ